MKRKILMVAMLMWFLVSLGAWAAEGWVPSSPTVVKIENNAWLNQFGRVAMLTYSSAYTSGVTNIPTLTVDTTLAQPLRFYGAEFLSGTTVITGTATVVVTDAYGFTLVSAAWSTHGSWLARPIPMVGNLTVTITGNSVSGATGTVKLIAGL